MKRALGVGILLLSVSLLGSGAPRQAATQDVFHGRISIRLVSFPLRVLDRDSRPVPGIRPGDLAVTIKDLPAKVLAVEKRSSHSSAPETGMPGTTASLESDERHLIVFFFETSFEGARLSGQVDTLPRAKRMLESFAPGDWVAVTSFDSHFKLRQDFTHDRHLLDGAMNRALLAGPGTATAQLSAPSLARHMRAAAARKADSPERALELVGNALAQIQGEKTVILIGWGLGRFGADGPEMTSEYAPAREALLRAGAVVFVLDVTNADYHSLEFGLRRVAADTGGAYRKTNDFPDVATAEVASAIENDYEVTVLAPALPPGDYELAVRLIHHRGRPSPSSRRILLH